MVSDQNIKYDNLVSLRFAHTLQLTKCQHLNERLDINIGCSHELAQAYQIIIAAGGGKLEYHYTALSIVGNILFVT